MEEITRLLGRWDVVVYWLVADNSRKLEGGCDGWWRWVEFEGEVAKEIGGIRKDSRVFTACLYVIILVVLKEVVWLRVFSKEAFRCLAYKC